MASFVKEVLNSAGKLEMQEVQDKLDILTKSIESLKLQVHEVTFNKYVDFQPSLETSKDLTHSVEKIVQEMDDVVYKIESEVKSQLNTSTAVVKSLEGQLKEAVDVMTVLDSLVKAQDALQCITSSNRGSTTDFAKAANSVLDIQEILNNDLVNYSQTHIVMALKTEFNVQKQQFLYDLGNQWMKLIEWTIMDEKEKKVCKIKFATGSDQLSLLKDIIVAMEKMDILDSKLKAFSTKVMANFIEPCIFNNSATVEVSSSSIWKTVAICYVKEWSPPAPKDLFSKLVCIVNVLVECCLHITLEETEKKETLMQRFGATLSTQVLDMVVKECLTRSIPASNKDLADFHTVINFTETFHAKLVELKFIPETDTVLLDFIQNVNVLFANKKCQEILVKAQRLLTSETHHTVLVTDEKPLGDLPLLGPDGPSGEKIRKLDLTKECRISNNTFRLPSCHISSSILQLMGLAYETLQEATESSHQCAIQMFYSVRNMLELFCDVFPTYHKKNLINFPQLSAIFHNNCLFVAHHLMTLGHQFHKMLPDTVSATFVDLVPKIRKLGVEVFQHQLSLQKGIITEYLKGAKALVFKGFANVSENSLNNDAERAIKQTMHQFQHLQKVWQDVLPPVTYRKAIGKLLNSTIQDITASVVMLEDISSEDARQTATLLTTILDKAGALFVTPSDESVNTALELQRNVPKWLRFKELITVLNASLLNISDRWAEGKGPLAVEFSATEMKQMIRALFQNTERRANVLSKIK